jgi:hypothetical protein
MAKQVISQTASVPRSISSIRRETLMIAYTAWDSLQAIAQQYDADLVIGPEQGLGLTMRRDRSFKPEAMRRFGKRLRAELAVLWAPAEGRVSEEPVV